MGHTHCVLDSKSPMTQTQYDSEPVRQTITVPRLLWAAVRKHAIDARTSARLITIAALADYLDRTNQPPEK